eukprot:gene7696-8503_t
MSSWGEQFRVGDQSEERRKKFFEKGRACCPLCSSSSISSTVHVAGCRHNGDGYGTEVFLCQHCSWTTSFYYDEAGESYYYEMAERPPATSSSSSTRCCRSLTEEEREKFSKLKRLAPREHVERMMTILGIFPQEISSLLD